MRTVAAPLVELVLKCCLMQGSVGEPYSQNILYIGECEAQRQVFWKTDSLSIQGEAEYSCLLGEGLYLSPRRTP